MKTRPNEHQRYIMGWLQDNYHVTLRGMSLESGGKHAYIKYSYGGQLRRILVPYGRSPNRRARAEVIADLKRELGPPPVAEKKIARKLEDMMVDTVSKNSDLVEGNLFNPPKIVNRTPKISDGHGPESGIVDAPGKVASYETNERLTFVIPATIARRFLGEKLFVVSHADDAWDISIDDVKGMGYITHQRNEDRPNVYVLTVYNKAPSVVGHLRTFGATSAEYCSDGVKILVRLTEPFKPLRVRKAAVKADVKNTSTKVIGDVAWSVSDGRDGTPILTASSDTGTLSGPPPIKEADQYSLDMKDILLKLKRVEFNTLYKLRRGKNGEWLFYAPPITLD